MLMVPMAEILLRWHQERPIDGDVLFIGRQAMPTSLEAGVYMLARYGVPDAKLEGGPTFVSDTSLMRSLGAKSFSVLDIAERDTPDFRLDLGLPVPTDLHRRFDFIYNGGCFDNMFNPGEAMMNISRMLRPGGRALFVECATPLPGAYLMFSPGWFRDFFEVNGYASWEVSIAKFGWHHDEMTLGPWELTPFDFTVDPQGSPPMPEPECHRLVVAKAEKGEASTN